MHLISNFFTNRIILINLIMTQKSNLIKYKKKLILINKYKEKRQSLFIKIFSAKSFTSRRTLFETLRQLPRNSCPTRSRNYCLITGRPRGFYRFFSISRNMLRLLAQNCFLPGVQKSSW